MTQYRTVTDRQTDRHMIDSKDHAYA